MPGVAAIYHHSGGTFGIPAPLFVLIQDDALALPVIDTETFLTPLIASELMALPSIASGVFVVPLIDDEDVAVPDITEEDFD